jgi:hypothetical protein
LAAVKLTNDHVIMVSLCHKINSIGVKCSEESGQTEYLYIAQKEDFPVTCFMCDTYKPITSSERMLHKDYDLKGSVGNKLLVMSHKRFGAKTY